MREQMTSGQLMLVPQEWQDKALLPEPSTEAMERDSELAFSGLPPQLPMDQGKLTVVLDVDETLIHTWDLVKGMKPESGVKGCFNLSVGNSKMVVAKRPFLDEFLREASQRFELIVFTAGSEEYARPLLDAIDPFGVYFRHRLYRHHCTYKYGDNYVKDLRILNRDLNRTVLVDNNPHSFLLQLSNGIPIAPFVDDASDKALVTLFDFLLHLTQAPDVKDALRDIFALESMFGTITESVLVPAPKYQPFKQAIVFA